MAKIDYEYRNLVQDIIEQGVIKDSRAGQTRSVFAKNIKYDLREGLPILTTKRVFSKGCIHELLWFIKGDTNIKYLLENGVHIWDDDAYRYYIDYICKLLKFVDRSDPYSQFIASKEHFLNRVLDSTTLQFNIAIGPHGKHNYRFGDLGPIYGEQWTNWNNKGINQLDEVVDKLKNNPDDRRLIVSAWNVESLSFMALPPCHYAFQFYTEKLSFFDRVSWANKHNIDIIGKSDEEMTKLGIPERGLSCMWQQRSVDVLLGLPFNFLSYSILTYMIAQCVNMAPRYLIFNGGDCHIYENQLKIYQETQALNSVYKYDAPSLWLNPDIKELKDFTYDDIRIDNYKSFPAIKYPLSTGL